MLILALDSCGASCGASVWQDGRVLAQAQERMQRGQDARLIPIIVAVMAQAGHNFSDLDKIAVTRGPGSFTGARVGLATARGIGLAANKPVIGIDRFSIYRLLCAVTDKNLLVVIESKRAELFCKFFPAEGAAQDACMMTEAEIQTFLTDHPDTVIAGDNATPEEDILAACARLAAEAEVHHPDFLPRPLYLRPPDVTVAASARAS